MICEQLELPMKLEMFDGFKVKETKTIVISVGVRQKLVENDICYFVTSYNSLVHIRFPNNYSGAYGFNVSQKDFNKYFIALNKKAYPKSKEIWNVKARVKNPDYEKNITYDNKIR